jgi:hypothetical protein
MNEAISYRNREVSDVAIHPQQLIPRDSSLALNAELLTI